MNDKRFQPIDPRDAFTVRPRRKTPSAIAAAEDTESVAASQAAFLLALRAGDLGDTGAEVVLDPDLRARGEQ